MDCIYHVSCRTHGEGKCRKAAPKLLQKSGFEQESTVADHHKQGKAMLATSSNVIARLSTLAIEPTFLTRVHEATWQTPDAEMRKLVRRARGTRAQFHVGSRHGLE